MKPCNVKRHFSCDGTGQMCHVCGESEAACRCDEPRFHKCADCGGTGRFCVEHDSPCSTPWPPHKCYAALAASEGKESKT
jgi:hypothetical protein